MQTSLTFQLQAKYTDLLLLSKSQLCTERELDILSDHLGELNEDTPRIKVLPEKPVSPELIFGIDTNLWDKKRQEGEQADWTGASAVSTAERVGGSAGAGWHGDEVEVKTVWSGSRPGTKSKGKEKHVHAHGHAHAEGESCGCEGDEYSVRNGVEGDESHENGKGEVVPLLREHLEVELGKLNFEIYRSE